MFVSCKIQSSVSGNLFGPRSALVRTSGPVLCVPAHGLAVFRGAFSLVLLAEVCQMFYFRRLIFDLLPYIQPSEVTPTPLLCAWLVVLVSLAVGYQRLIASAVNYICSLLLFTSLDTFCYHCDFVVHAINLLLLFLPTTEAWSVDAWLKSRRERQTTGRVNAPCSSIRSVIMP